MLSKTMDATIAGTVAIHALAFLTSEPARMERFVALTGFQGISVENEAEQTQALAAILRYLLEDEPLLVTFAEETGRAPDDVMAAHHRLAGPLNPG